MSPAPERRMPGDATMDGNQAAPPWNSLDGKVVMVTGASSGIGRDFCLDLARAGCCVVAAARRTGLLASLCDDINGGGGGVKAVAVELDVSAPESAIDAAVQRAWGAFGRIDALVNNAGIRGDVYSPLDWPEDDWNKIIGTNLTGLWLVSKHICRRMRNAGTRGSVINISSTSGVNRGHLPGAIGYVVSKSAVNFVTKVMAVELGECGIRVNAIAPGIFKSEITESLMQKKWLPSVVPKTVPLQRLGTVVPALTSLVRYLVHDSSEYVSGNIFIVDSGATLPGIPIYSSL